MNQPLAPRAVTILGNTIGIPVGGTIRSGIKVLTRSAAQNPEVVAIYNDGVAAGLSFDEIQKRIRTIAPNIIYPMTPKNVPYFTVRGDDFPNPETAKQILEMYGEDRGEGLRLYRFPVIFAADSWQTAMPHNMTCFASNEIRFWSEFNSQGERECHCKPPLQTGQSNGKRVIRPFGPKKSALRAENNGVCDPESCNEYQSRQCNLSGRFLFHIPGIKGLAAFQLQTRSFHAMNTAIQIFNAVTNVRGGVSGYLDSNKATFYISKIQRETNFINEEGQAVTALQWIINLEANVDVAELLYAAQNTKQLTNRAAASAAMLEAQPSIPASIQDTTLEAGGAIEFVERESQHREVIIPAESNQGIAQPTMVAPLIDTTAGTAEGSTTPDELGGVVDLLDAMAVESSLFFAYADAKYGVGWRRNPNGRLMAETEIRSFNGNAQALVEKMTECLMKG